jgi:hypothetical protein
MCALYDHCYDALSCNGPPTRDEHKIFLDDLKEKQQHALSCNKIFLVDLEEKQQHAINEEVKRVNGNVKTN